MLRKISFISAGSFTMLFCCLFSIASFANDKSSKHKHKTVETTATYLQSAVIAELYVNSNFAYFPINNNNSFQLIQQTQQNPSLIEQPNENKIVVTKDDYHYYFNKNKTGFEFLYAVKDNNIPLFDGYEYENEIKIPVGQQIFKFSMFNGRPVGLSIQANSILVN